MQKTDAAGWRGTIVRILLLTLILGACWMAFAHWRQGWAPSRDQFPNQGIAVSAANGELDWPQLAAKGVDFAYITATSGSAQKDPLFEANLNGASEAGIRFGAIHKFDLCHLSGDQADLFVTTVPRRANALPPVIELSLDGDCMERPAGSVVLSELSTLINLVEAHSDRPALLHISAEFEQLYKISSQIHRTIWLDGNFFPPDYAAIPWVMWTANNRRVIDGADGTIDWLVVRPQIGG